ncbi:MAG: ABC-2 transporter permease [Oscillospiraceae bacterium]
MKGLLLKDILTLKSTLKTYAILIVFYAFLGIVTHNNFMAGFMAVFLSMIPITALSYDERANFSRYALTMPLSKAHLVLSKYLLGLVLSFFGGMLIFVCITFGGEDMTFVTRLFTTIAYIMMGLIFQALLLPIMFKFGSEKGRLYMLAVLFIPTLLIALLAALPIGKPVSAFIESLDATVLVLGVIVLALALYVGSVLISIKIMNKKEF